MIVRSEWPLFHRLSRIQTRGVGASCTRVEMKSRKSCGSVLTTGVSRSSFRSWLLETATSTTQYCIQLHSINGFLFALLPLITSTSNCFRDNQNTRHHPSHLPRPFTRANLANDSLLINHKMQLQNWPRATFTTTRSHVSHPRGPAKATKPWPKPH